MILITKARNMSLERIAVTKFLVSLVYYLVLAVSAFLLTRDDSSKIDWPIDMEVPEYKKHMLEALTVFLISLIGFKNFYFDFSSKNLWVIISVLFYLTMLVFGLFYKQIFDFLNYENDVWISWKVSFIYVDSGILRLNVFIKNIKKKIIILMLN